MIQGLLQAIILGLLQGFTEFLPVSSTAHLIILPKIMKWQDFGLAFDIAIHLGSLIAIISYFFKDQEYKKEMLSLPLNKLCFLIAVATIPVGLSGLLFKSFIENNTRSIEIISFSTIIFGIILGAAYYYNQHANRSLGIKELSTNKSLLIGIAQSVAIIPGVSRSGITLTASLLLGFNIKFASRFSFLLSFPVIILAGAKQTFDLIVSNQLIANIPILITGFVFSMVSSYIFIILFFKYIDKIGIWPFVIYRILLGMFLYGYS